VNVPEAASRPAHGHWLRRAGLAGSLFFLIKGLLWILVPATLAWLGN
jgi:hypothetical protein